MFSFEMAFNFVSENAMLMKDEEKWKK